MYKIIVASHGPMAEGMKKSLEFVMGPAENVTALCLDEEGISKFAERAKRLVNDQNTEEILVMVIFCLAVHLMNFKTCSRLCRRWKLLPGVNLPALVEAVNCQEDGSSMETVIPQIKEAAVMKTLREILAEEESGDDDE